MEERVIKLTTEKELKIIINPVRQRILRIMEALGTPITAKRLAVEMDTSPASAKHHLTLLESIGLVEPDHTELIHGITAQYYRAANVVVRLGMEDNDFRAEHEIIAENQLMGVFRDFASSLATRAADGSRTRVHGDFRAGVVHLTEDQYAKLHKTIVGFINENQTPKEGAAAYEFALVHCEVKTKK